MKKLKKLTCFVLALALMLSSLTFVSAASQEAKNLNKLGLLLNVSEEELNQTLNRVIGITMVLKALGYKDDDVKSKASDNPFVDMDKYSWAKGFAAVAYENKITNGISHDMQRKEFGPTQPLTKKQLLTFMLRVLGYDEAKAWNNTEELARQAGILTDNSENDSNFTKDDAAKIMYAAMKAKLQNNEGRLIDRLVAKGKVKKEAAISVGLLEQERPKTFDIESVTANNLRQIEVVFTREVDKDSAKRVANYKLTGAKGVSSRSISEATLKDDNRTVLLTVGVALSQSANPSVLENKKDYVLTVKDVKDVSGQVINKVEKDFTAEDGTPPEVQGIEFTGPRSVKITFNEPIKILGKVKVTQGSSNASTSKVTIDPGKANVINVETYSNFKTGTSYRFETSEMKDFANYVNILSVEDKVYEADNSTPTATVVAADQGKVEVVFDRPVKGITPKHFYHSYPHQTAKEVYKDSALKQKVSSTEYVSKVWVVFATGLSSGNYPLPAQAEFYILGKVNALQIADSWGNKFSDFREYLSVTSDHSAPVIDNVDVQSETRIVITYNKDLSAAGTYKIMDGNGKTLATPSVSLSGKTVTLKFSKIKNKSAILEIRGVKDNTLSRNEMAVETRSIEFTDKTFDGVASADFRPIMDGSKIAGGEIYVNYNEEVADNALEPKNYYLEIGSMKENLKDQRFAFGDTNRTVIITLDDALAKRVSDNLGTTRLVVGGVTDLAGNSAFGFQTSTPLGGVVAAVMTKAVLTRDGDNSKVEIHFNRSLRNILKSDGITVLNNPEFIYDNTENLTTPENLRVVDYTIKGDDSRVVEVTLSRTVYSPKNLKLTVGANVLEDSHEAKIAGFTVEAMEDKVAPKVLTKDSKKQATAYKSGGAYYVSIKYTEAMDANSLSSATYRIDGTDDFKLIGRPAISSSDAREVIVQVEPKAGANFGDNFGITQTQTISDLSGNRLEADSEMIEVVRDSSWN